MKRICISLLRGFMSLHFTTIPISALRCEQKKVAIAEGWGGQTIDYFPPCGFYKMFKDGFEKEAFSAMKDWYYERFMDRGLHNVTKRDGGMYKGSLYKLIVERHHSKGIILKEDLSNANRVLILDAITTRVEERFELFKSIRLQGYPFGWDYISSKKENDNYILIDGHHRASALYVCGYTTVITASSNLYSLRIAAKLGRKLMGPMLPF